MEQQDTLEAIAQMLEIIESRAATGGKPYEWSPSDVVRKAAKDLARLRDALHPLASCANEYFADAPQGTTLDTIFVLAQARKAAAAMSFPTHMQRA